LSVPLRAPGAPAVIENYYNDDSKIQSIRMKTVRASVNNKPKISAEKTVMASENGKRFAALQFFVLLSMR
jgi:hypothetical protein